MRVCNCPGILAKASAAFVLRLLGWAKLGADRPDRVGVHIVCDTCGRVWTLELRGKARDTAARNRAVGLA